MHKVLCNLKRAPENAVHILLPTHFQQREEEKQISQKLLSQETKKSVEEWIYLACCDMSFTVLFSDQGTVHLLQ